ncbi:MAG TPA: hypothetical protein VHX52_11485 [Steroidobacteraceae bacterium]|jgi:hypothetical protein|nr:hypothetical protein [Steroidobacteraceae bacterium]
MMKTSLVLSCAVLAGTLVTSHAARAQFGPPPPPAGPPPPAQKAAPIDLTGYWVSVVTEDWRWRMLTPPHGDYASVPLNPAGRKVADMWTTAEDGSCKAYGAAGLMRMPTRVHVTWADENTLKLESDWGEQTRMIYFRAADMPRGTPTLQGSSLGEWERPIPAGGGFGFGRRGPTLPGGDLKVVTDSLAPGWLRRNGVPYGTQTHLLEHYQTFQDPTGKTWFDVTTQVDDPEYLAAPFITSSDFRREPDGAKWAPHPCKG